MSNHRTRELKPHLWPFYGLSGFLAILIVTMVWKIDTSEELSICYWRVIFFTIFQALVAACICVSGAILLLPTFRKLASCRSGKILRDLLGLPYYMPSIVGCLSLILVFGNSGILAGLFKISGWNYPNIYGIGGILLCHVFYYMPFALGVLSNSLSAPNSLLVASLPISQATYYKIILPILWREIRKIFHTVFLYCTRAFTIVLVLGGTPSNNTIEVAIFQALHYDLNINLALKLSVAQLFLNSGIFYFLKGFDVNESTTPPPSKIKERYERFNLLDAGNLLIIGLVLILPIIVVFCKLFNIHSLPLLISTEFLASLYYTILIGAITSLLALSMGLSFSYANYYFSSSKSRLVANLPELSVNSILAISPTIISLMLMMFCYNMNKPISLIIISFINSIFIVPVVYRSFKIPYQIQRNNYDPLCATLTINKWYRLIKIDLPGLKPIVGYVFVVSMIVAMGDYKIILFFNNEYLNLPALIYKKIKAYEFSQAATICCILTLINYLMISYVQKLRYRDNA